MTHFPEKLMRNGKFFRKIDCCQAYYWKNFNYFFFYIKFFFIFLAMFVHKFSKEAINI